MYNPKIEELNSQVSDLQSDLEESEALLANMGNDPAAYFDDLEEMYDSFLNEIYAHEVEQVTFVTLPEPAELLKENDPVAYRCGFSDWCSGYDVTDRDEYKEVEERIEELQAEIDELENEIVELEE